MQICYSKNEQKEEIKYTTKPVFLPSRFVVEATLQIIFLKAWVFFEREIIKDKKLCGTVYDVKYYLRAAT